LFAPILDRVNTAMADVAKENQFMFVFDQSTNVFLYADESLDVTNLSRPNLVYPIDNEAFTLRPSRLKHQSGNPDSMGLPLCFWN
jgi:hypothetical protein